MSWLDNLSAKESNLNIDGEEVCAVIEEDTVLLKEADGGNEIDNVSVVLLENATFSDNRTVFGTVDGVEIDAELNWNLYCRLFGNDLCNAVPVDGAGFEISETVRTNSHDVESGDVIESSLYACVMPEGAGVMFSKVV